MDFVRFQTQFGVVLHPFAALYRLILALRRNVWESGLARRLTPTCPCISVGNIAWGGTGKTPLTDWLMSWAERKGLKTVVLSRGYKADLSVVPVYVKPEHSPREVGDEPLMLGLDHPACAVLVDPDRRRSGAYALQALAPELILLDDGMQHVAVQRNLDMVLLRPVDLQEAWGRVLPEGSWREGASALTRAGVFLIKCPSAQLESLLPEFRARLETLQRPVFSFTLKPCALERLDGGRGEGGLGTRPYALVTGVGNPQQVAQTATEFIGRPPEVHLIFPDHHTYTFKDTARFA
ncbi:MAG: tetraacyldisaccharide 4'-kinase, partial [Bilophila sp.]